MHLVQLELAFCHTNINAHSYHSFNCEALTLLLILSCILHFALDICFGHNFFEMPPSWFFAANNWSSFLSSCPLWWCCLLELMFSYLSHPPSAARHCTSQIERKCWYINSTISMTDHCVWTFVYTRMPGWVYMNWMQGKPSAHYMLLPSSIQTSSPFSTPWFALSREHCLWLCHNFLWPIPSSLHLLQFHDYWTDKHLPLPVRKLHSTPHLAIYSII